MSSASASSASSAGQVCDDINGTVYANKVELVKAFFARHPSIKFSGFDFLDSLEQQLLSKGRLSVNQERALDNIIVGYRIDREYCRAAAGGVRSLSGPS